MANKITDFFKHRGKKIVKIEEEKNIQNQNQAEEVALNQFGSRYPDAGTISGDDSTCVGNFVKYSTNGDRGGEWDSSDSNIATINLKSGILKGISAGIVTISYSVTRRGKTSRTKKTVTINEYLNAGIIKGEKIVCVGSTISLSSTVDVVGTWSSNNINVATVSNSGVVTGISEGSATITFSVSNICGTNKANASILVKPVLNPGNIIGDNYLSVGATTTYTTDSNNSGGFWSSSNIFVASVEPKTGIVKGISEGSAIISYSVTNLCGTVSSTKTIDVTRFHDRVLFLLKENSYPESSVSTGLYSSAKMVADYLETTQNQCKISMVKDAGNIQTEIDSFNPTVVIIEALWLDSVKLDNLMLTYETIKWVIRIHSNAGFLAAEPQAFKFIHNYIDLNNDKLILSCNNNEFAEELSKVCNYNFKCLPDIFDFEDGQAIALEEKVEKLKVKDELISNKHSEIINIGSFGALRLLKNQLFQAMCAILAADKLGMILHFHINADQYSREPVLLNIRQLFKINAKHKLICHEWLEHDEFEELIKQMDMGLQLSYTESFNIITADFVYNEVPILVSETIDWMPKISIVSDIDYDSVVNRMVEIYKNRSRLLLMLNKFYLFKYNVNSKSVWNKFIV